jgi:small ligand-binding sensory domain FIST
VNAGAGLSTLDDPRSATREAVRAAAASLGGRRPDLAVVFVSSHHADAAGAVLRTIGDEVSPGGVIGCVAQGVVGGRREVEEGSAV